MRRRKTSPLLIILLTVFFAWVLVKYIPEKVGDLVYRTDYEEYVEKYSKEYSVDPALVYSVIKVESNFNPAAVSDKGAIGLMQMIEDSFDWIAGKIGREDLSYSDLYEPEYSIMFGCYYLGYLYARYGSVELTAAAYHSGMTKVDKWIAEGKIDPENVRVEDITGSNAAHYAEKILKAYGHYSGTIKKGTDQNV